MGESPPAAEAGAVPGGSSFPGTRNSAAGADAGQDEASGAESGNSSQATGRPTLRAQLSRLRVMAATLLE